MIKRIHVRKKTVNIQCANLIENFTQNERAMRKENPSLRERARWIKETKVRISVPNRLKKFKFKERAIELKKPLIHKRAT